MFELKLLLKKLILLKWIYDMPIRYINGRQDPVAVDIVQGSPADHTIIRFNGLLYQRHIADGHGGLAQCRNCVFSSHNNPDDYDERPCPPTHGCSQGADVICEHVSYNRSTAIKTDTMQWPRSKHAIYWTLIDPISRIPVNQIEI